MLGIQKVRSVAIAALLLSGSFVVSAQADTFSWSFLGPTDLPPVGGLVSGSGLLTATGGPSAWNVTGVSGFVTDTDIPGAFTINAFPSSYAGADNILYYPPQVTGSESPPPTFVDFGGISFGTTGGDFNLGLQYQNGAAIYVLNSMALNNAGNC